jgi:hypothetical protein
VLHYCIVGRALRLSFFKKAAGEGPTHAIILRVTALIRAWMSLTILAVLMVSSLPSVAWFHSAYKRAGDDSVTNART